MSHLGVNESEAFLKSVSIYTEPKKELPLSLNADI